jgi:hypothetical protein
MDEYGWFEWMFRVLTSFACLISIAQLIRLRHSVGRSVGRSIDRSLVHTPYYSPSFPCHSLCDLLNGWVGMGSSTVAIVDVCRITWYSLSSYCPTISFK